jgi:hypothetical protein
MPNGELQGDDKALPDRGTSVGHSGHNEHLEGADLGPESTNRLGSIKGTSKSDAADPL